MLGEKGERVVEHYSFYAAFQSPEEFRLEFSGRTLGPDAKGHYVIGAGGDDPFGATKCSHVANDMIR